MEPSGLQMAAHFFVHSPRSESNYATKQWPFSQVRLTGAIDPLCLRTWIVLARTGSGPVVWRACYLSRSGLVAGGSGDVLPDLARLTSYGVRHLSQPGGCRGPGTLPVRRQQRALWIDPASAKSAD